MHSVLPPSRPATTLPAPPPDLDELCAGARARLDAPLFPASFGAPCAACGLPRLSAIEAFCVECSVEGGES